MPILHENEDTYIYDAIVNTEVGPKYTWDENNKVYKYSNTKFPNKNYTKTFDPKTLNLSRGDVVHFGSDDYRNHYKLIFDGEKFVELWTDVDDYGSVPPTFVCGDEPGDFDIGDFEDVIDHNTINWLSKEKLKEIEILKNDDKIYGKVQIQGKVWKICIDIHDVNTFSKGIGWWGSRPFKCVVDPNIKIHKKATYLIHAENGEHICDLKSLLKENDNNIHIIDYSRPSTKISNSINETVWFLFQINKETKYTDMTTTTPNFPIIWRKVTKHWTSEKIVFDQKDYDNYMKSKFHMEEKDNTYIREVTGYTVNITMVPSSTEDKLNCVKQLINELIENYDNINKRHPFHNEGGNILQMYI
jgi:hypothetical protein